MTFQCKNLLETMYFVIVICERQKVATPNHFTIAAFIPSIIDFYIFALNTFTEKFVCTHECFKFKNASSKVISTVEFQKFETIFFTERLQFASFCCLKNRF